MDDLPAMMQRDFGLRPQGRSAPMAAGQSRSVRSPPSDPPTALNHSRSYHSSSGDAIFSGGSAFDDVFGGPPRYSAAPVSAPPPVDRTGRASRESAPVYDKPLYDDDIFEGLAGVRSSSSARFVDVFATAPSGGGGGGVHSSPPVDDVFESLGNVSLQSNGSRREKAREPPPEQVLPGFEELIPRFDGSIPSDRRRDPSEARQKAASSSSKSFSGMNEDPFAGLEKMAASANSSSEKFIDPLEQFSKRVSSGNPQVNSSSASEGLFDDIDGHAKSANSVVSEVNEGLRGKSSVKTGRDKDVRDPFADLEMPLKSSAETKHRGLDNNLEPNDTQFTNPSKYSVHLDDVGSGSFRNSGGNKVPYGSKKTADLSSASNEGVETMEVWLSVAEIHLFTQPSCFPPPSRPPPPLVIKHGRSGKGDQGIAVGPNDGRRSNNSFVQTSQMYSPVKKSHISSIDELEDFAMGKPQTCDNLSYTEVEFDKTSTAVASEAAMKEAMDRAEAKFRQAKEVRERERDGRSSNTRGSIPERDMRSVHASQDIEYKEAQEISGHQQERREERLNRETELREREEKEREEKRQEEREQERERLRARKAVELATREARERAAAEARQKAERAAVEKANAEARQQAERLAVQRTVAEARERAERAAASKAALEAKERAAAEARERAERASAAKAVLEAKERAAAQERAERDAAEAEAASREREAQERAAVAKATQESRKRAESAAAERVAQEARERAAASAREKQRQYESENDLESIFGMGPRANSAPKQRASSPGNMFNVQGQNRGTSDSGHGEPSRSASANVKRPSSVSTIDDFTALFGAPSSDEFQEIEGESEERRKHRFQREQRTRERAAQALAEKNERDMQIRREQEERQRHAETLDADIRRWAAGKEGNMRALLSTLQYILWPELGWAPVSLTDLITPAAVKAKYRKATLCVHPDKVQQKGATLQQKYIAEKVFDILKEAWNKFNSEELF